MNGIFKKQSIWHTLISIAILAFAVYFLCKISINVFSHPYAVNEYREAADVQLTQAFLDGDNPYRTESLTRERESGMPPVLYQYSFLNSALGALVALLIGGNAVTALYVLSLLSMIGSGILVYLMIRRQVDNTAVPMIGAVLVLFCHWRFGYLSTTPNSLGIFLMLLTTFFVSSSRVKGRLKLIITAILSVLLFYTKLYFVTVAFGIFVFMFMYKKADAFKYLLYCLFSGILSVLVIQLVWPLYFTYSVYFLNGMGLKFIPGAIKTGVLTNAIGAGTLTAKISVNVGAFSYVFEQFGYIFITFAALFIVLLFSMISGIIQKRKVEVLPNDILALSVILTITQALCMFVLGRADGTYLTYYLQLFVPYVIVASLICADRYIMNGICAKSWVRVCFLALFAFVSIYFGYHKLPLNIMSDEAKGNWKQAEEYTDNYNTGKIYYSPELAYIAMKHGERSYDNGHSPVACRNGLKTWEQEKISHVIFPYADDIALQNLAYQDSIKDGIKNHEYSLVTINNIGFLGDTDFPEYLKQCEYKQIDVLPLAVGNATYDVEFWIPAE